MVFFRYDRISRKTIFPLFLPDLFQPNTRPSLINTRNTRKNTRKKRKEKKTFLHQRDVFCFWMRFFEEDRNQEKETEKKEKMLIHYILYIIYFSHTVFIEFLEKELIL
jgi:hypothetical protein